MKMMNFFTRSFKGIPFGLFLLLVVFGFFSISMKWHSLRETALNLKQLYYPTLSPQEERLVKKLEYDTSIALDFKGKSLARSIEELRVYNEYLDASPNQHRKIAPGLKASIPHSRSSRFVALHRRDFSKKGYLLFLSTNNFGYNQQNDSIGLIKSKDQADILRIMQTSGPNYDIDVEKVVKTIREWHKKYGLIIVGADYDWFEAKFINPPSDIQAFAKEVYEFCPDVVDQGTNTVEKLAREMEETKTVYCWWD